MVGANLACIDEGILHSGSTVFDGFLTLGRVAQKTVPMFGHLGKTDLA